MKKLIKNNIGEVISFILTIIIFCAVFKMIGVFDNSVIISDLKSQVYPLLEHVKNNGLSLFDLNLGIGDSTLGLIYYYLMSPFNLIYFIIKDSNISFLTIIILKSAFSALFCYKYLKYQFSKEKKIIFIV